jgi:hypothetical protein
MARRESAAVITRDPDMQGPGKPGCNQQPTPAARWARSRRRARARRDAEILLPRRAACRGQAVLIWSAGLLSLPRMLAFSSGPEHLLAGVGAGLNERCGIVVYGRASARPSAFPGLLNSQGYEGIQERPTSSPARLQIVRRRAGPVTLPFRRRIASKVRQWRTLMCLNPSTVNLRQAPELREYTATRAWPGR